MAIGIDLGTTNSVAGCCIGDNVEVIENNDGYNKTPSVVQRTSDGFIVGHQAANQRVTNPEATITSVKRRIGDNEPLYLDGEEFSATQISSCILSYIKSSVDSQLGTTVNNAVVTVPAYFNHQQRVATREAAQLAGLSVLRILSEPTAACIAHGLKEVTNDQTVLVYDLGGGTFDVSLVTIKDGIFEVVGTDGDDQLGGDDWDGAIVAWLLDTIESDYDITIPERLPLETEERLFKTAQETKHILSNRNKKKIQLPFLEIGGETITVETTFSRDQFEQVTDHLVSQTIDRCQELFNSTPCSQSDVDEIILVGGSTRMPMIREAVEAELGQDPRSSVNPDTAVARGAAVQAAILESKALPVANDTESNLPAILGDTEEIVLLDSVPNYIGIESLDISNRPADEKIFSKIISQNENIPTENTEKYVTIEDSQEYIKSRILESREGVLDDAEQIEEFTIGPLPKKPAGDVSIEVTIAITNDGTLEAEIAETSGAVSESLTIEGVVRQSKRELEQTANQLPAVLNK